MLIKSWLAATAAIALIAGAALAQSETTTTQTTTVTNPPVAGDSYSTSKTQRTLNDGTQMKAEETYRSGVNGTSQTFNKSVSSPDRVRQNTYHEERTVTPDATTTTKKTTTTTTTAD